MKRVDAEVPRLVALDYPALGAAAPPSEVGGTRVGTSAARSPGQAVGPGRGHCRGQRAGRLARLLESEDDTDAMLAELVAEAVRLIAGAQDGSLSMVTSRTRFRSRHPTSALASRIDEIQTETGQGPCLDAVYEQQTVRVIDLRAEHRWPKFARRAVEEGDVSSATDLHSLARFVQTIQSGMSILARDGASAADPS